MKKAKKVYEYRAPAVQRRLVAALRSRRESTVADLVTATGLPTFQVQQEIKAVVAEYRGHLKVTESGEILYYFPHGLKSRQAAGPRLLRGLHRAAGLAGRILAFLFKVWIMVMLVGYFLLFLTLVVMAIFASFAISVAGRQEDRGRGRSRSFGFGGFYLMSRMIDLIFHFWFYRSLFGGYGPAYGPAFGRAGGYVRKPPGKPFYKSVFAYVFGTHAWTGQPDPEADWRVRERLLLLSTIRGRKGVICLEEILALTGLAQEEAQELVNRLLLEYNGEPAVTEAGTLIYLFPDLLQSAETLLPEADEAERLQRRPLVTANDNPASTNRWITFFNGFNLIFGGYFLYFSQFPPALHEPLAGFYLTVQRLASISGVVPAASLGGILGVVPFSFSLLFALIPLVRRARLGALNERIREENYRRLLYARLMGGEGEIDPESISPREDAESPRALPRVRQRSLAELESLAGSEVRQNEEGRYLYSFSELRRRFADVQAFRRGVDEGRYNLGKTVFDSGEQAETH